MLEVVIPNSSTHKLGRKNQTMKDFARAEVNPSGQAQGRAIQNLSTRSSWLKASSLAAQSRMQVSEIQRVQSFELAMVGLADSCLELVERIPCVQLHAKKEKNQGAQNPVLTAQIPSKPHPSRVLGSPWNKCT